MGNSFRQSMTWLHTWAGLVFCWVLYFIFVTGTLGYFDTEIDRWMKPEIPPQASQNIYKEVSIAEKWLYENGQGAHEWIIQLPSAENHTYHRNIHSLRATAVMPVEGKKSEIIHQHFDINTGDEINDIRETGGGQTLYKMHWRLHYLPGNTGYRIVGILTLIMFVAMISGIIIHKNIFKDFFTFRPNKGQRSWLDLHNLFAVSSLPFQLMITYSGLIFVIQMWMVAGLANYGFDIEKVQQELGRLAGVVEEPKRTNEPAVMLPISEIIKQSSTHLGGTANISRLIIHYPGDKHANVRVETHENSLDGLREAILIDGVNAKLLHHYKELDNIPILVRQIFVGLHEGLFADIGLRWLYFFAGLLGTAMIATGAIYWSVKRERTLAEQDRHFGHHLVSHLNIGILIGLPIAIAAYFWANRLLPIEMADRAEWEIHCLFLVWLAALLHPLLRRRRQAWLEQLLFAATAFTLLPVINALTTDRHLLHSLSNGDWVYAGFDLTCLAFGIIFGIAAIQLKRRWVAKQIERVELEGGSAVIDSPHQREH